MKYHSQNCPIYLSQNGKWAASVSPYCSCGEIDVRRQEEKKIYKVFECTECLKQVYIPIDSIHTQFYCEHDKFNTGTIKKLVDICQF